MNIDANLVIEKLILQISQQARDIAILQVQVDVLKEELRNKETQE